MVKNDCMQYFVSPADAGQFNPCIPSTFLTPSYLNHFLDSEHGSQEEATTQIDLTPERTSSGSGAECDVSSIPLEGQGKDYCHDPLIFVLLLPFITYPQHTRGFFFL